MQVTTEHRHNEVVGEYNYHMYRKNGGVPRLDITLVPKGGSYLPCYGSPSLTPSMLMTASRLLAAFERDTNVR